MNRDKKLFKPKVILTCLFFLIFILMFTNNLLAQSFKNPLIGSMAPDFTVQTKDGRQESFLEICDGKNTILVFWATWCYKCQKELKNINQKKSIIESKDIHLVLVNAGEKRKKVDAFLQKHNLDLNVYIEPTDKISKIYNVYGLPGYLYINSKGKVIDSRFDLIIDANFN